MHSWKRQRGHPEGAEPGPMPPLPLRLAQGGVSALPTGRANVRNGAALRGALPGPSGGAQEQGRAHGSEQKHPGAPAVQSVAPAGRPMPTWVPFGSLRSST